jgi:hypothetical protein
MKCKCIKTIREFNENDYYDYVLTPNYDFPDIDDINVIYSNMSGCVFSIGKFYNYFVDIDTYRYNKLRELYEV